MNSSTRFPLNPYPTIPARDIQSKSGSNFGSAQRCHACQLQLCKSRDQAPHAGLQLNEPQPETVQGRPRKTSDTVYTCQVCGAALVHSPDRNNPGWRKFSA